MAKPPTDSQLLLAGDHLALLFPYVPDQIAELKLIDGAKWDRLSRTWRVPLRSIEPTIAFATRHGFWISPDLTDLQLPKQPNGEPRIEATTSGYTLYFPYDPVKVKGVKQIPGATWNSDLVAWQAPASSVSEVVTWADEWGLRVPPAIRGLVEAVVKEKAGLYALSSATSLEEPLDIPRLARTLFDFQHVGVKYALQAKRTFIADQMGLGKTAQAIATLEAANAYPAVIVVPPTLQLNWVYEFNAWVPHRKVVALSGMAKKAHTDAVMDVGSKMSHDWATTYSTVNQSSRAIATVDTKTAPPTAAADLFTADVVVVGYSTVGAWLPVLKQLARSAVFDESHYVKNSAAKRTKAAIKLAKGLDIVLCLTGTPVASRPAEYASQLKILGHIDQFGGEWAFYKRYCDAFKDRWGQWHRDGHSNMEELNEKLRSICYVRRLKVDVLPELGERRSVPLYVEGDLKVMDEYWRAERDIATYMAERARAIAEELGANPDSAAVIARIKAESAEHLVRMSALRRIAARAKMPAVEELVSGHIEDGSKVVLAAHHREIVQQLADRFGGYKIIGGQDIEEVELMKNRFQTLPVEEVPVIVLSTQAAKTGHTLTAAQDIIVVELPWTPADFDQVVDRLHRIGQTGSVLATSVLIPGTIDETMWELLDEKRRVVTAVTDGSPLDASSDVLGGLLTRLALQGLRSE